MNFLKRIMDQDCEPINHQAEIRLDLTLGRGEVYNLIGWEYHI